MCRKINTFPSAALPADTLVSDRLPVDVEIHEFISWRVTLRLAKSSFMVLGRSAVAVASWPKLPVSSSQCQRPSTSPSSDS